jgi:hypothetical protein
MFPPFDEGRLDDHDGTLDAQRSRIDDQVVVAGIRPVGAKVLIEKGMPIRFRLTDIELRVLEIASLIPHDVANAYLAGGNETHAEGLLGGEDELASPADDDRITLFADSPDDS